MVERLRAARGWVRRNVGAVLLGVLLTVGAVFANTKINDLGDEKRDAEALSDTRGRQVLQLGGTPAVSPQPGPSGARGRPGEVGPSGPPGRTPTQVEIGAIVADYLRRHPPPAGRPPTMAEILTVVTQYLREHPPPAGPSGAPGEDGRDGRDGVDGEDGEDAPPPTDEQIRTAVEAYMATHPLNCLAGYHLDTRTIPTTDGLTEAALCVRDQE